jgi:hypothetical protein
LLKKLIIYLFGLVLDMRKEASLVDPQIMDACNVCVCRLEKALRKFSCLTQGDTIVITHMDRKYLLDVAEVRPGNAISVYETDVQVTKHIYTLHVGVFCGCKC